MKRTVLIVLALMALSGALASPASANCYEHCHQNSNGDWVCHTNCY